MDDWVFVDTCIWASFFTKPNSAEKIAVDQLLSADRIALAGPIVSEVLIGFRRKNQADWIASRLKSAYYVEATWSDWQVAADLGRGLASNGQRLPLSDLMIGAIAKRLSAFVYTTDPHFDLMADLKRLRP